MANAGFGSLGDFTGLGAGQPPAQPVQQVPAAGLLGMVDFTGLPVGQPPTQVVGHAPRVGCLGFLDFCGYPVGGGGVRRRGHGPKIGPDRNLAAAMIQDLMARRRTQRQYVAEAQVTLAAAKVRVESVLNEANQRQAAHDRCMALILAEV